MASQAPLLFIIAQPSTAAKAAELAGALTPHGIESWYGSLAPGGQLANQALATLRNASAVLLLFDRAAAASREVDRHLLVARQEGKPLIPVRLEAVDEGLLRQELLDAQWIDGSDTLAAAAIAARVYNAQAAERSAIPPVPPKRGRTSGSVSPVLLGVGVAALLAILAVLIFIALRPSSQSGGENALAAAAPSEGLKAQESGPSTQPSVPTPMNSSQPRRTLPETSPGDTPQNDDPPLRATVSREYDPETTVRRFYAALSRSDGSSAAALVIPEKRTSGPLSAAEITRYYSRMRRPLRLLSVRVAGDSAVMAEYDFILPSGQNCRGTAVLSLVEADDGSAQISGIRTINGC